MPNIGALFKQEITRLCKREIRKETVVVKKASAAYRRDIAALKRKVALLDRQASSLSKRNAATVASEPSDGLNRSVRFVAKGLRSLRTRLGLSAAQLARLLGVSEQSVFNWETKKATPRKGQLGAIISLRGIGKREAHERLDALKAAKPVKPRKAKK